MSVTEFTRKDIVVSYKDMMYDYLCRTTVYPAEKIRTFLDDVVTKEMTKISCTIVGTRSYGNDELIDTDLLGLIARASSKIVVPSGSIYNNSDVKKSIITELVLDCKRERGEYKKLQFDAEAAGDMINKFKYYYAQTLVKINMNSLPGGFGSPFNLFYNKPNYNAITSNARTEIRRAVTVAEQLLGGNFAWFNEQDLINHILLMIRSAPSQDQIIDTMTKHKLMKPTHDELFTFYLRTVQQYDRKTTLPIVRQMIHTLPEHLVCYMFYYMNLRHVLWYNQHVMKPYLEHHCDTSHLDTSKPANPDAMKKLDGDFEAMLATLCSDMLNGLKLKDVGSKAPQLMEPMCRISEKFKFMLSDTDDIFKTFIDRNVGIPDIDSKPFMFRNTVVVSDTDSVIYTLKDWVQWHNGDLLVCPKAYQICGLITYWLTKTNAKILDNFAKNQGVAKEFHNLVQMKNEFLYPRFLLYPIKKHYAGIMTIQEGLVLPSAKPDIKGGALRGSTVCRESNDYNRNFILNEILLPSMKGRLSAKRLIAETVQREQFIIDSIKRCEDTYLKMVSLKANEKDYAKPLSSQHFHYLAWMEIFSEKYGEYRIPTKVADCQILAPNDSYLAWLKEQDPKIHAKFLAFYDKYERWPSAIALNPTTGKIPAELVPLVNIRKIVSVNLRPVWLSLRSLNIGVGFEKSLEMFSDVY